MIVTTTNTNTTGTINQRFEGIVLKKSTEDTDLGISFSGEGTRNSPLIISEIEPHSRFATETYLSAGLRVLSINEVYVAEGWSALKISQLLYDSKPGKIEIIAQGIVIVMDPPPPISFIPSYFTKSFLTKGSVMISRRFGVKEGQYRLSMINDEPCPSTPEETTDAVVSVALEARQLKMVAIDAYLGGRAISYLDNLRQKKIKISSTITTIPDDDDNFDFNSKRSSLRSSFRMDLNDMKESEEERVVSWPLSSKSSMMVVATKLRPYEKHCFGLGLSLCSKKGKSCSYLVVESISPTSIFYNGSSLQVGDNRFGLQVGDRITAINGLTFEPPHFLTTTDVTKVIQDIESTVSFEVLKKENDCFCGSSQLQKTNNETNPAA